LRITRLNIENFGHFSKRLIDPVDDALTVVHGPNEAGKSAIRAFIRSTLFGYLDRRSRNFDFYDYPPVNGGSPAGSVDIVSGNGAVYSVRREQGRNGGSVMVSGDANGGVELLERLFDRIGPDLYQNLFSVSLSELQEFATLNSPEIRDRIYSVGLGLSRVSLPDAMAQIDKEMRGLRGPKSGSMRKAEKSLHETRLELEEARKDHALYADVTSRLADTEQRIAEQTDRLEEARKQRERQKLIISLRPHWERKNALDEQVANLPQLPDFPGNAERQLDGLILQVNNLHEQMQRGDQKQDERTEEVKNVPVVEKFEDHVTEIRQLVAETEHYRKAVEDLPGMETNLRIEEEKFSRDIEMLGSGWDRTRIAKFNAPVDLMADLHAAGRQVVHTRAEYEKAEADVQRRNDDQTAIEAEVSRAAASRDSVEGVPQQTSDELDRQQGRLERMRGAIAERVGVIGYVREAESKLAESLQQAESTVIGGFIGSIWMPVALILLALSSITYIAWAGGETSGVIPAFGGLVVGILLLVHARTSGKGFKISVSRPALNDARSLLTTQRDELKAKVEELNAEVKAIAAEFGLKGEPTERDIAEKAAEVDRSVHRRVLFETRDAATKEAQERLKAATDRHQQAADSRTLAYNNYATSYARWQEVLKGATLRDDLEPDQANSVMERIRALQSQLRIVESYTKRVEQMKAAIKDIESRLTSVLEFADMPAAQHMQATPSLMALAERFREHELAVERRERLILELDDWIVRRDLLERRISQVDGQVHALLRYAETSDEQEFRQTARLMEQRWATEAKIADIEEGYPLLVSEDGAQYREELSSHSLDELQARLERLNDEVRDIEAGLGEMQRERGDLESQRKRLESSSKATELRAKINMLEEQVASDANEWAVLRIAAHMLEKTRETFQRERQPALIQSAAKYFEQLTMGRYTRIEAVVGEQDLVVYEANGARKGVAGLSRGTAEQLYLSMRFALIEEYARNAEPMPVIMDDVLVNFDPVRARAACEAIVDLSSRFQVLMLTCHPQTVAYFQEICAAQGRKKAHPLRVINLDESDSAEGQLTLVG
jgi:uncharacterized protein YhaN